MDTNEVKDLLLQMRSEHREDHRELAEKVDTGHQDLSNKIDRILAAGAAHELKDVERFAGLEGRLAPLEAQRKTVRWIGGTVLIAAIGGIVDLLVDHLPRLFKP